jgi:hypothetical protein
MLAERDPYGASRSCLHCRSVHDWHSSPPLRDVPPERIVGASNPRRDEPALAAPPGLDSER